MSDAFDVGAIVGRMKLELGEWKTSMKKVRDDTEAIQKKIGDMSRKSQSHFKAMATNIMAMLTEFLAAGAAVTGAATAAVKAAMDVQEAENLFAVSFGAMSADVRAWSEELAERLPLSAYQLREQASIYNMMIENMGFAEEQAASMSKELTMLAQDMASLYNMPLDVAFQKLSSGLAGEIEPLRRIGVIVTEVSAKQALMRHEVAGVGKELTEQQKVLGRYLAIMDSTQGAQGDLERTSGQLANQWRGLTASVYDLRVEMGQHLIPMVTDLVSELSGGFRYVREWAREFPELAKALVVGAAAAGAVATAIGGLGFVLPSVISGVALLGKALFTTTVAAGGLTIAATAIGAAFVMFPRETISAWHAFSSFVNEAASHFVRLAGDMGMTVKNMWHDIRAAAYEAIGAMQSQFEAIPERVRIMSLKVQKLFREMVIGLLEKANVLADGLAGIPFLGGAVDGVQGAISGHISGLRNEISAVADEIAAAQRDMARSLSMPNEWKTKADDERERKLTANPLAGMADELMASADFEMDRAVAAYQATEQAANGFSDASQLASDIAAQFGEALAGTVASGAASAAGALGQLKESGVGLWRSLWPVRDVALQAAEGLAELRAAGLDDGDTLLRFGEQLAEGLGDLGEIDFVQALASVGAVSEEIASGMVQAQRRAVQEAGREVWEGIQGPSDRLFAEMQEDLDALKAAGYMEQGDAANLFARSYWDTLRSLGGSAIRGVIGDLRTMGDEGAQVADELQGIWDRSRIASGQSLLNEILGLGGIDGWKTDLNDLGMTLDRLVDSGQVPPDAHVLAAGLYPMLRNVAGPAFEELLAHIREIQSLGPEVAAELEEIKNSSGQWFSVKSDKGGLEGMTEDIQTMSQAVASLGGGFEDVADGADVAVDAVKAFAAFGSGDVFSGIYHSIMAIGKAFGMMGDEGQKELKGMDKVVEELGDSLDQWADDLTDTIVDFVKTGKASFKEFADSVLEDILRIVIRYTVVEPLVEGIGGMFAKGAAFQGGNVLPFASGGVVSKPTLFPMAKGNVGLMGEAGPEAVMPLKRLAGGRLGVSAESQPVTVNVYDQRSSGEAVEVKERQVDGMRVIEMYVRDAVKRSFGDGSMDSLMTAQYGVRRKGA